ncbi:MAG: hypothetical protein WCP96_10865 [Methylococcaceae bacterium]
MKNHHIKYQLLAASLLTTAIMAGNQAHAAIITNGDFAANSVTDLTGGLYGWTSKGSVQVQPSVLPSGFRQDSQFGLIPGPATHHAILGSGGLSSGIFNQNGSPPVSTTSLENFFKPTSDNWAALTLNSSGGSAIQQTFSSAVGQKLSFNWNFFSNAPDVTKNDSAFLVLDGKVNIFANTNTSRYEALPSWDYVLTYQTGYGKEFLDLAAGVHTLSFGIIDGGAYQGSALALTNVQLNSVPLPAACWLFLIGVVGLFKCSHQFKHA